DDAELAKLARKVVAELLAGPQVRLLLREAVLLVSLEQKRQQESGAVRTFLEAARGRGVKLSASPDGRLMVSDVGRLGADLKAVYLMYRQPIIEHLIAERHLEERRRDLLRPATLPMKQFATPGSAPADSAGGNTPGGA